MSTSERARKAWDTRRKKKKSVIAKKAVIEGERRKSVKKANWRSGARKAWLKRK